MSYKKVVVVAVDEEADGGIKFSFSGMSLGGREEPRYLSLGENSDLHLLFTPYDCNRGLEKELLPGSEFSARERRFVRGVIEQCDDRLEGLEFVDGHCLRVYPEKGILPEDIETDVLSILCASMRALDAVCCHQEEEIVVAAP